MKAGEEAEAKDSIRPQSSSTGLFWAGRGHSGVLSPDQHPHTVCGHAPLNAAFLVLES